MKVVALTQRQQKVLDFIRSHFLASGHPPTLREIGAFMGIRSTNGVNDHLKALERKGVLIRGPKGRSRSLRPIARSRERDAVAQLRAMSGWVRECPADRVADALDHLIVLMTQRYPEAV